MSRLFWQTKENDTIKVGLTRNAIEMFGQIWAIIPTNERKRNFKDGDPIVAVEGSDGLACLNMEFTVNRINFNPEALDRPDELNETTPLFFAEAA
jgi:glycine cleavage system H lipoate-binding protein